MGLKTTLFAVLLVIVITWRNARLSDLDGKKYSPFGIGDVMGILPDTVKELRKRLKGNSETKTDV